MEDRGMKTANENGMSREDFKTFVGIALGEVSVCWSEIPSGVFDASRAAAIAVALSLEFNKVADAHDVLVDLLKPMQEICKVAEKRIMQLEIENERMKSLLLASGWRERL